LTLGAYLLQARELTLCTYLLVHLYISVGSLRGKIAAEIVGRDADGYFEDTHTHTHTHTHKQLKLLGVTETDLSPATSPKKENKYSATKDVAEGEDSKAADAGSDAHGSAGIECVLC